MDEKFKNAINRVTQDVPPVWMMRQAGRYQKSYRKLREQHSFMNLCKKPELSALVGLNAVKEFDFDLAILFSDLLFPLEAFGMGLEYSPGPQLGWRLSSLSDFDKLNSIDEAVDFMSFQGDCVRATREVLPKDKSLIGFVGGTWTLFGYAVEGSHKGGLIEAKKKIDLYTKFKEIMEPLLIKNIAIQLDAGAEIVMVFDTAVGELNPKFFNSLVRPSLELLCRTYPGKLGYYTKGTTPDFFESSFLDQPWAGLGWDHRWDLTKILQSQVSPGFVQGNFDQALLHQDHEDFKATLKSYFSNFESLSLEDRRGWVAGLGHGVLPKTPEDNVKFYVEYVRETFSK